MLSIDEIDRLARQPNSFCLSCTQKLNTQGLKDEMWDALSLCRVYTKKKGQFPDFADPLVITPQRGTKECTVENAVVFVKLQCGTVF